MSKNQNVFYIPSKTKKEREEIYRKNVLRKQNIEKKREENDFKLNQTVNNLFPESFDFEIILCKVCFQERISRLQVLDKRLLLGVLNQRSPKWFFEQTRNDLDLMKVCLDKIRDIFSMTFDVKSEDIKFMEKYYDFIQTNLETSQR